MGEGEPDLVLSSWVSWSVAFGTFLPGAKPRGSQGPRSARRPQQEQLQKQILAEMGIGFFFWGGGWESDGLTVRRGARPEEVPGAALDLALRKKWAGRAAGRGVGDKRGMIRKSGVLQPVALGSRLPVQLWAHVGCFLRPQFPTREDPRGTTSGSPGLVSPEREGAGDSRFGVLGRSAIAGGQDHPAGRNERHPAGSQREEAVLEGVAADGDVAASLCSWGNRGTVGPGFRAGVSRGLPRGASCPDPTPGPSAKELGEDLEQKLVPLGDGETGGPLHGLQIPPWCKPQ